MSFHTAAYFVSIAQTADTDVPALTDDILTILNNHFILRRQMQLVAAAVMSATLSRAKLASPSMRQVASPFVRPIIGAVKPASNPNMWLLDHNPFTIPALEEIQLQATSGLAMGNENLTGLIWLQDTFTPAPQGNVIPLRWTSTTAAVANAWTSIAATFTDTVPSGVYSVVFSEHKSANAQAHRLIFSGQELRPGNLSYTNLTDRSPYAISKGQWGLWGNFRSTDLPRFQVLCNAADAAHEGYLYVVKTGNLAL